MELTELLQFITDNGGTAEHTALVQQLAQPKPVDELAVRQYLDTDEGYKNVLKSKLDSHFDKTLNSWKENNLQKLVDAEVAKANQTKDPAMQRVEELEAKLAKAERDATFAARKTELVKEYNGKLDPFFIEKLISDDEEATKEQLETAVTLFDTAIQAQVSEHIKSNGRQPAKGTDGTGTTVSSFNDILSNNSIIK